MLVVELDIGTTTYFVWDITGGAFPPIDDNVDVDVVLGVVVVVVVVDDDDTTVGKALIEFAAVVVSSGASVDFLEKKLRTPPKKLIFLVVDGGVSVVTVDLINFCPISALA